MIENIEIDAYIDAEFVRQLAGLGGTFWGHGQSSGPTRQLLFYPSSYAEAIQQALADYPDSYLVAQKIVALERLAERRKQASRDFTFAGMSIVLDADTESAIAKATQGLERQEPGSFISFEMRRGVFVRLDLIWLQALGDGAFAHVQACFSNVERITNLVYATTTLQALEAIDINIGWPQ